MRLLRTSGSSRSDTISIDSIAVAASRSAASSLTISSASSTSSPVSTSATGDTTCLPTTVFLKFRDFTATVFVV
jgi:hypothetical protein